MDITNGDTTSPYHSVWKGRHAAYRAKSPWKTSSDWKGDWVSKGEDFDHLYADTIAYTGKPVGKWMEYSITRTVQFFVDNPFLNFGVVIAVAEDDPSINHALAGQDTVYQGYAFAAAVPLVDSLKPYKPQLEIVYNENSSINNNAVTSDNLFHENIQVNDKLVNIYVSGSGKYSYSVYTVSGKALVKNVVAVKGYQNRIIIDKAGMLMVTINDGNKAVSKKIAVCK